MKYLKKILKIILVLSIILVITVLTFLGIDSYNTKYLKLKNHSALQNDTYIINNVNVVPMTSDTILYHKSVYVKNGIIVNIDDPINEDGITVIDGQNKFLSPGLIDMHMHLWDKQELGLYLANGVTTVRNLWGFPLHLRVKEAIKNNELIGPMFFVSSPKLTGAEDLGDDKVQIDNPETAKTLVKQYKDRGYDFIKTYAGIPKEIMAVVIEQSIASDISIISHPSFKIPYLDQFHTQIASIEHAEDIVQQPLEYKLDSIKLKIVINRFVDTKMSFSPTLTGFYKIYEMLEQNETILDSDLMHYMNPLIQKVDSKVQFDRWANEKTQDINVTARIHKQHKFHLYILKKMNEAGVNIVCGTDAGIGITAPGYAIHQELELYHEAGLSNYDALKTATINPTKTHKEFKNMGSIELGKLANFVLTNENPLENLSTLAQPEWVMIQGRKLDKTLLETFTNKAYNRSTTVVSGLRYGEYLYVER